MSYDKNCKDSKIPLYLYRVPEMITVFKGTIHVMKLISNAIFTYLYVGWTKSTNMFIEPNVVETNFTLFALYFYIFSQRIFLVSLPRYILCLYNTYQSVHKLNEVMLNIGRESFCICVQSTRDGVTLERRLSLAWCIQKNHTCSAWVSFDHCWTSTVLQRHCAVLNTYISTDVALTVLFELAPCITNIEIYISVSL